jgi:predicted Rossmann-fold nucleotide-binding protein
VYQHYLEKGKQTGDIKETLARILHDHSMNDGMDDFLGSFEEKSIVGIMGGHGLSRTDEIYRKVALVSKKLTESGCVMVSGGGPGAMEATHLGAWMAGKDDADLDAALKMLSGAPSFKDRLWLDTAFQVMEAYPCPAYVSLGVPTWLYGHEPATPFATHIAKYFDNSTREDLILTIAKGGVIYSPGSAGTMQEIFQDAVQNHYLSFGYASPMIFLGVDFWMDEMPVYRLMQHLVEKGKYKNLLLSITDDIDQILTTISDFRG